jgi:PHD/YefM family antitoxin component YafN of YafNO toxin-antitoxin module
MVTRHGVEVAVWVSKDEWQRVTRAARRDAVGKGPRFRRRAAP